MNTQESLHLEPHWRAVSGGRMGSWGQHYVHLRSQSWFDYLIFSSVTSAHEVSSSQADCPLFHNLHTAMCATSMTEELTHENVHTLLRLP